MRPEKIEVSPVTEGIQRIHGGLADRELTFNCYLLSSGGETCLVDAGPASIAAGLVAAVSAIAAPGGIRTMILLDGNPVAHSCLGVWLEAGFRGEIIADWRVLADLRSGASPWIAGLLAEGGNGARLRGLRDDEDRLFPEGPMSLRVLRSPMARDSLCLLHEASAALFSGRLGSSLAADGDGATDLEARRGYRDTWGYGSAPDLRTALPTGLSAPSFLCPRFGPPVPGSLVTAVLGLASEPPAQRAIPPESGANEAVGQACGDGHAGSPQLMLELESLRTSNYQLKEMMISSSDAALRDSASGLYARVYADAFLHSLLERKSVFNAAFVRIDHIKELNRRIGPAAVDLLIQDFTKLLQEREPEGFLFRWSGPVLLLILEGDREGIFGRLEAMVQAVAEERRFTTPITASVALVRSEELGSDPFNALQALARERLKLLDNRGGNAILDRSDRTMEDRSLVLVLDSDALFLDYLVEALTREGFRTIGASRGGAALEMMDQTRPELVIADRSLPQFDAFQIRMRMRASNDLHDIPFILLTSGKNDELVAQAHHMDIMHIFEKPVSIVEITGIARSLMSRSEDGA